MSSAKNHMKRSHRSQMNRTAAFRVSSHHAYIRDNFRHQQSAVSKFFSRIFGRKDKKAETTQASDKAN